AFEQLEGSRIGAEMQDALLGADRAAAGRQQVEIDLGAEPHPAAMASAFPRFLHVRLLTFSVAWCWWYTDRGLDGRHGPSSAFVRPRSGSAAAGRRQLHTAFGHAAGPAHAEGRPGDRQPDLWAGDDPGRGPGVYLLHADDG